MRNRFHGVLDGLPILTAILIAIVVASVLSPAAPAEAKDEPGTELIVIDGLQWAQATNGRNLKWPEAVEYCDSLVLDGHADWRLPTLEELESLHDPGTDEGIRSPFVIGDCCLWSGESLVDRPAEDGEGIAGRPGMYPWGFMFDGGLRYYAVHIFEDGRALCTRDVTVDADLDDAIFQ